MYGHSSVIKADLMWNHMSEEEKAEWERQAKEEESAGQSTGEVCHQETVDEDSQQGGEEGDHQETDSRQGGLLYMLNVVTEYYKQQQYTTTE